MLISCATDLCLCHKNMKKKPGPLHIYSTTCTCIYICTIYMYLKFLYFIYFKISQLHTCISEITSFWPACCTTQFVSDRDRNPKDSFLMSHMSRVVRKPAFCTRDNKDTDQLRGIRYTNSTIPLLHKSETSSI